MKCDNCNNVLDNDSKFCSNCGAVITEESLSKITDEKPASKVKVFIYQTITLLVALVLSFIIKMLVGFLFVSMNITKLSEGLDALGAISGLILVFGLWYLLSGLSLKNKKHQMRGYNLIATYAIVVIIVSILADKTN